MPGIMATDVNTATVVPTCKFNLVQTKIVKSALNVYVKADGSPKIKVKVQQIVHQLQLRAIFYNLF